MKNRKSAHIVGKNKQTYHAEQFVLAGTRCVRSPLAAGLDANEMLVGKEGLSLVAPALPAFREVAETRACFLDGANGGAMAQPVEDWLAIRVPDEAPNSRGIGGFRSAASGARLQAVELTCAWHGRSCPGATTRFAPTIACIGIAREAPDATTACVKFA
jgi:hypothetical protein